MTLDSLRADESEVQMTGMSDTRTHSDGDPAGDADLDVIPGESGRGDLTADQQNTFMTDG